MRWRDGGEEDGEFCEGDSECLRWGGKSWVSFMLVDILWLRFALEHRVMGNIV